MNNLVLVGFSASGKTTIGRILSRRLRLRFVDTDRYIEQSTGRTIPRPFGRNNLWSRPCAGSVASTAPWIP